MAVHQVKAAATSQPASRGSRLDAATRALTMITT